MDHIPTNGVLCAQCASVFCFVRFLLRASLEKATGERERREGACLRCGRPRPVGSRCDDNLFCFRFRPPPPGFFVFVRFCMEAWACSGFDESNCRAARLWYFSCNCSYSEAEATHIPMPEKRCGVRPKRPDPAELVLNNSPSKYDEQPSNSYQAEKDAFATSCYNFTSSFYIKPRCCVVFPHSLRYGNNYARECQVPAISVAHREPETMCVFS